MLEETEKVEKYLYNKGENVGSQNRNTQVFDKLATKKITAKKDGNFYTLDENGNEQSINVQDALKYIESLANWIVENDGGWSLFFITALNNHPLLNTAHYKTTSNYANQVRKINNKIQSMLKCMKTDTEKYVEFGQNKNKVVEEIKQAFEKLPYEKLKYIFQLVADGTISSEWLEKEKLYKYIKPESLIQLVQGRSSR